MMFRHLPRCAASGSKHAITIGKRIHLAAVSSGQSTCMGDVTSKTVLSMSKRSLHAVVQGRGLKSTPPTLSGVQHVQALLGQPSPFGMFVKQATAHGSQTLGMPVCTFSTRNVKDTRQLYRGVTCDISMGKWRAWAGRFFVGSYDNIHMAARQRDVAMDYLVQKGVFPHRHLDFKNVSLGNLRKFKPPADDVAWVEEWWAKKTTKTRSSVYKGVYYHTSSIQKPWIALLQYKMEGYRGSYATEVEAALARDKVIRALDIPKREKLWRLNFFLPSDYLNRVEAEKEGCIGASFQTRRSRLPNPFMAQRLDTSASVRLRKCLGYFVSITEAGRAYDRDALAAWAQQNEPRGPLPPTNFCPTEYGYELPLPPPFYNPAPVTKTEPAIKTPTQ
eukprot:comp23940_c2_seq1/m.42305 comp23940_c2_seq1/g.42305  ORF comp23940_c2_seq1/g.42305 comp23940_c2_seq1/m.42305 type:complete len:389 (-) comp23940_c2_seq1:450-1616(-)